jgi:transposase-like protein
MSDTELLLKSEPVRRVEVFTGTGRRRTWTAEQKLRIVAESYAAGAAALWTRVRAVRVQAPQATL